MNTYTDKLPRFWWLRPWHHARRLHATVLALRNINDVHARSIDRLYGRSLLAENEVAVLTATLQRHAKPAVHTGSVRKKDLKIFCYGNHEERQPKPKKKGGRK